MKDLLQGTQFQSIKNWAGDRYLSAVEILYQRKVSKMFPEFGSHVANLYKEKRRPVCDEGEQVLNA